MKKNILILLLFLFPIILPVQAEVKEMEDRLPGPDDPVLFSVTEKNVTMDIISLDTVSFPVSEWTGIPTEEGTYEYFLAGICFTALDDGEWMVIPGLTKVGDTEIMARTYGSGGMTAASGSKPGRICGQLGYDITDISLDWSEKLTLGIRDLFAAPREGSPCKDIMHRYETNCAAQALDIELSCTDNITDEWIMGPKDFILTVSGWDHEKWSQEEAQAEIEKLLDYRVEGNWTFTINEPKKYIK